VDGKNAYIYREYRYNQFEWKKRNLLEKPAKDIISQGMPMNLLSVVTETVNFLFVTEHVNG